MDKVQRYVSTGQEAWHNPFCLGLMHALKLKDLYDCHWLYYIHIMCVYIYIIFSYILHVTSTYHMINPLRSVASGTESDPRGDGHALAVYMVLMSNTMLKTRCNM